MGVGGFYWGAVRNESQVHIIILVRRLLAGRSRLLICRRNPIVGSNPATRAVPLLYIVRMWYNGVMKYTPEMLEEAVKNSTSFSGVLRYLNAGMSGSNHGHIKRRIIGLGIDHSHFATHSRTRGVRSSTSRRTPDEILVVIPETSHRRMTRRQLLLGMLSEGVAYRCAFEDCPNPEPSWRGERLALEIDHIDGNWRNCLISNLRFLCPNCHSQTESNFRSQAVGPEELQYVLDILSGKDPSEPKSVQKRRRSKSIYDTCSCGGKKTKSAKKCSKCYDRKQPRGFTVKYPPIDVLINDLKTSSYTKVADSLDCSDNAIRKHVKRSGYDPKTFERLTD